MAGPRERHADNIHYCTEQVRAQAPDLFLSAQFAPADDRAGRGALMALHAFGLEIHRIPATVSEPPLGAIRQQWWRDALDEIAAGGAVRAHPVVEALTVCLGPEGLIPLRPMLDKVIDATGWFLDGDSFSSLDEALARAALTHGALCEAAARVLSPEAGGDRFSAIRQIEAAATLARLAGPQGAGDRSRVAGMEIATFSERLQELGERNGMEGEALIEAIRTAFRAGRAGLGELRGDIPTDVMPAIAHAALVPLHLKAASRLRRTGSYAPGPLSELHRRARVTGAILTGRL